MRKTKALADFIVRSFICCPLDLDICIEDCKGWKSEMCAKCVTDNIEESERIKWRNGR